MNIGPGSIQLTPQLKLDAEFDRSRDVVRIWVKSTIPGKSKRGIQIKISEEFLMKHAEEVPPGGEYCEETLVVERDSKLSGYEYRP